MYGELKTKRDEKEPQHRGNEFNDAEYLSLMI